MNVEGEKTLPIEAAKEGEVHANQDREKGKFNIKVTLLQMKEPTVKRIPPEKNTTQDGIVRWIFTFDPVKPRSI